MEFDRESQGLKSNPSTSDPTNLSYSDSSGSQLKDQLQEDPYSSGLGETIKGKNLSPNPKDKLSSSLEPERQKSPGNANKFSSVKTNNSENIFGKLDNTAEVIEEDKNLENRYEEFDDLEDEVDDRDDLDDRDSEEGSDVIASSTNQTPAENK